MNSISKIIVLSSFILFSGAALAQDFQFSPVKKLTTQSNSLKYKIPGRLYVFKSMIDGTVFLTDEWKKGSVTLEDGAHYDDLSLKLNTFLEELVMFDKRAGALIVIDKDELKEFTLIDDQGQQEIFRKIYLDQLPADYRYLNILYEGKIKLMLWNNTIESFVSSYYDQAGIMRNTKYVTNKIYFLDIPGRGMVKFNPQNSSFIELFPEYKKEIKRLRRKEHLTYKGNYEIVRAVNLIESVVLK